MLSPLKHIICISLLVFLMGNFVSCQSWHEAKEVIVEADRWLVKGVIMRDTAALACAIETLDKPITRKLAREELVKAYYLMGRNLDDYYHNFADAADYYIAADRLKTKDLILRGRINSCMGYICKQDSCFEEALVFYERSSNSFKASGNEWYYTHNLLNVAEQYVHLYEFHKTDSIFILINGYCCTHDSLCYARMMNIKAQALFNQQKFDSALVCLLKIKDYPRNVEMQAFSAMKLMQTYAHLDSLVQSVMIAKYILQKSNHSIIRSNAYFYLIQDAEKRNMIEQVAKYSHLREDEDRIVQHHFENYAQASMKLRAYLMNPNPYRKLWCYLVIIGILLVFIIAITIWLYRHYHFALQVHSNTLQTLELDKAQRRENFANRVFNRSIHFMTATIWKDEKHLRELANLHFNDMFSRLEKIHHFNERELQICLMVLLEYSREQMANILLIQPNTISKAKIKIAKEMNTTSAQLRDCLIDFLAI